MVKKHFVVIMILLFLFFTLLEIGILVEVFWHGWGGFGDISMAYTPTGLFGSAVLMLFIPVSVMAVWITGRIRCHKKLIHKKEFCRNGICALAGIGTAVGIYLIAPDMPICGWGRQMAAFLIDHFHWMEYPIP